MHQCWYPFERNLHLQRNRSKRYIHICMNDNGLPSSNVFQIAFAVHVFAIFHQATGIGMFGIERILFLSSFMRLSSWVGFSNWYQRYLAMLPDCLRLVSHLIELQNNSNTKPLSLKLLVRMEKVPQDQDKYRAEPCWFSCGFHLDYHGSNHKRERGKFEQHVFPCNI